MRNVCRESGFDGFLPKPADRDAIAAELDRLAGAGIRKAAAAAPAKLGGFGGSERSCLGSLDLDIQIPKF